MTALFALNIFWFEKTHRKNQFRVIAEQILTENADETNNQNAQLVELNSQIVADKTFKNLIVQPSMLKEAKRYFEEKYLTNNLSNYESAIFVYKNNSVDFQNYQNLIHEYGTQIAESDFFQISAPQSANSFIGIFPLHNYHDSIYFVVNLEPINSFQSYSFPNLLIDNNKQKYSYLTVATAKYIDDNLIASSGQFVYPPTTTWLSNINGENSNILYSGQNNFVLASTDGKNVAIVTDLKNHNWRNYLVYFFYGFLISFSIMWLSVWAISVLNHKQLKINIITRFQYVFFILFLLSFVGVVIISSEFIKRHYREQQLISINEKMAYIQKVLQEKYFYNLTLTDLVSSNLINDLHDLSYTFQTDIHIFDINGVLIATTQPMIFNKNLISRRIAPKIFFANRNILNQKEQIGNVDYLVNYTEFFNGDNLQIGYIAIPQYFSEIDINNETLNFLKFIIHIYVIALIISLIFSNIIRRQLSKPLLDLENKLRAIRLGKRNEKIEYKSNDEISQLVEQYNITVDELDRSAQLLAKSERESAWKLMAQQIAHEINNPLTPMKLSIQQLQRTKQIGGTQFDNYFNKSTQMLIEQINNLSHIAGTFSNFAKLPEAKFEKTNLTKQIASVVELFQNNDKNVIINYLFPSKDFFIFADPEQLQRVFNNLIKNAIQAIDEKQAEKHIEIKLQNIDNKVIVLVTDHGIGILSDIADKLFLPSFTTKSTGIGLGLAISKSIVETAGGTISFTSKIGIGTTFRVEFPEIN
jgi:signal transduction histidine kinase